MGNYVNPASMTKLTWLILNGEETTEPCSISESHLPVCLVNNGRFTAAGVGIDAREVEAFNQPDDFRPKRWFKVSRYALHEVGAI